MFTILVVLAIIVAVLLTFIVLIQESKGGGLAAGYAGGNALMGVRKTTDVVEKATWTLAALLVLLSVATTFVPKSEQKDSTEIVTKMKTPAVPVQPAPAAPGAPAK
ncbi:MAG: preprotein translocase subunit SecG [Alloprevotella sp.]